MLAGWQGVSANNLSNIKPSRRAFIWHSIHRIKATEKVTNIVRGRTHSGRLTEIMRQPELAAASANVVTQGIQDKRQMAASRRVKESLHPSLAGLTDGMIVRTYWRLFDPEFGSIRDLS